jgi:ubiquinone/menaquinone biosynthesis C-methylase UbiE
MVGVQGGPGGTTPGLTSAAVRAGYDTAAPWWAEGPELLYSVLAQALVAAAPVPVAGRRVLDLGAGTGVAGRAALAAGASQVVAADLAPAMLRRGGPALHPVAADAAALPFRDGSFDVVVAAFCLNHMTSIVTGLREARRVGAAIAASTFAADWSHPAKAAVDQVLDASGFRPPAWHAVLKHDIEPRAGDPEHLASAAAEAGFTTVQVHTAEVATGLSSPPQLASWRLGMAHVAPFLRSLGQPEREAVRRAAERAVARTGAGPLVVSMLVLTAW